MTDFSLTIDPNFADGNTMEPSHWTVPIEETEDFLQGLVGRDGVGIDNITADLAIHGVCFEKSGLADIYVQNEVNSNWGVCPETAAFTSQQQGITPFPIPNGTMRIPIRQTGGTVKVWVFMHARVIGVGSNTQTFYLGHSVDGLPADVTDYIDAASFVGVSTPLSAYFSWTYNPGVGDKWITLSNVAIEAGDSRHLVFGETHMMAIVVYK